MIFSSEAVELAELRRIARNGTARRIREAAGVSRSELARDLRVHESTVQKWEAGLRSPRGDAALRYGRLLTELDKAAQ